MAYGTINADVIQSSVTGVSLGAGNATRFKNRIINGNMVIDQRNAGASVTINTTAQTYTVDRWRAFGVTSAGVYTVQQNSGSVTLPTGYVNYLGAKTTTADASVAAGSYYFLSQLIEGYNVADLGWGTASAKTITLSFQVYSSLTGTFGGSVTNSAFNRSYPFTYTISSANTWTSISVTIAGDTSGTWLTTTGIGIGLYFDLGSGSSNVGTAGAWAAAGYVGATGDTKVISTLNATFYITGVQFEVGSSATGFEYIDYGAQLIQCQRYCTTYPAGIFGPSGSLYATSAGTVFYKFPVTMRTDPTVTGTSTSFEILGVGPSTGTFTNFSSNPSGSKFDGVSLSPTGTFGAPLVYKGTGILSAEL